MKSTSISTAFQKKALEQKIKRHLLQKYGSTDFLDYIDLNALIDPTLSYSENLKIVEQQIATYLDNLTKMQIRDLEQLANNVVINLSTGEIIKHGKHGRVSEIQNIYNNEYIVFHYIQNTLVKYIPKKSRAIKKMLFSKFRTPQLISQLNILYNNEIE
jgi:hypothetical protein